MTTTRSRTITPSRARLAGLVLVLAAGAGLTACGGGSKGTALQGTVSTTVAAATPTIPTTLATASGGTGAKPTTTVASPATTAKPSATTAPAKKVLSADDVAALEKQLDEIDKTLADAQAELDNN